MAQRLLIRVRRQGGTAPGVGAVLSSAAGATTFFVGAGGGTVTMPSITVNSTGWVTFGVYLRPGSASSGLRVGSFTTQTDVKNRHSDSSIKFAILTFNATSTGTFAVSSIAHPGGSLTPTWPTASMTLTIGGAPWVATLPAFNGTDSWLNGALCREARVRVTPTNAGNAHTYLRVVFDVRSYSGGGHRVDATVENTLDLAGTNRITYNAAFVINGTTVFSRNNTEHPSFFRWRKKYASGATEGAVRHDPSVFNLGKVLPGYLSTVSNTTYTFPNGADANGGMGYEIMKTGALPKNMGDPGGRQDLGPYPAWVGEYFAHGGASQLEMIIRSSELGGSWPIHITEANGVMLKSIDTYPEWFYYDSAGTSNKGPLNVLAGAGFSVNYHGPDVQHQPAFSQVAYLLTGDRFHLDEMAFWANWSMLKQPYATSNGRNLSDGLMRIESTRGIAWGMRQLIDVAYWYPDTSPPAIGSTNLKAYFTEKAEKNIEWCEDWAVASTSPTNVFTYNSDPLPFEGNTAMELYGTNSATRTVQVSTWQYAYMGWTLLHAKHLGFTYASTALTDIVTFCANLFNNDPAWPRSHAGAYYVHLGYETGAGGGPVTWLTSYSAMHSASVEANSGNDQVFASGSCPTFTGGGYGAQARMNLIMAQSLGVTNATSHLNYLMAYSGMTAYVNSSPHFALDANSLSL